MKHIGYGIYVADACVCCGILLESIANPRSADDEGGVRCPRCMIMFCTECGDNMIFEDTRGAEFCDYCQGPEELLS